MTRVALNGLGRIGKLALPAIIDNGFPGEIVLLNDTIGDPEQHAHLFEFDTVHGCWNAAFAHDEDSATINGRQMKNCCKRRIEDLPLAEMGIDLVVDCTGVFKTARSDAPNHVAGVKRWWSRRR